MISFQDFEQLLNGVFVDFDGYYGDQCVDLAQLWSKAIGGQRFWGNAKDIINQAGTFYDQVLNTPTNIPEKGDIVVWAGSFNGGAGHVGISTGHGDELSFEVLEQNDPLSSNCHTKTYNYNHVAGWLHPKTPVA